ncbi:MAG: AMP-binding protein [Burkholderiales bacterium]
MSTTMRDFPLHERTIGRVIAEKAARIPERIFLRWQGREWRYAELERMTNRYANGFAALGVRHGDRVALMMPNCPELLWALWGLGKLGAVAVALNTAAKGDMLRYFVAQSDASCLVVDDEWVDRVREVCAQLPEVTRYVMRGDASLEVPGARTVRFGTLDSDDETRPPLDAVRHDDTQTIVYTSGTTGPSKGVMCPQSQGHGIGRALTLDYGYTPDDVLYACLPLFHVNALWYSCYAALWADATVALSPRFSATRFWDEIRESRATQFNSLGAMTNIILQLPPGPQDRDHRVRQAMLVPMTKDLPARFLERYGIRSTSLFAMSENYAVTTYVPDDRPDKAGSAGHPRDASLLRIVDDDGRELPAGEVGEILMKPLQPGTMMKGYYAMPEATASAFVDGWFCTGDRGCVDADGYLWFVDRKKEAIRRRGENISAYEVELILSRHPAVLEVAAVPVPSEMSEDEVMVYVVVRLGHAVTEAEIVRFAAGRMSYFMVPRFVAFIDALPKTATEKIEKYKLKQEATAHRASLWDREREGIVVAR